MGELAGEPGLRPDDWAGMLAALERTLDRRTIAAALGVRERELDLIASGLVPRRGPEERLRTLHALSQRADLSDAGSLLEALGTGAAGGRVTMVPLSVVPHVRTLFIAFLIVDAVVVAAIMLFFFVR